MERLVSERVLSPSVLPGRRSQPSRAPPVRLSPGITKTGGDKGASQFWVRSQTRASRRLLSFLQDWLPSLSSSIGLASFLHQCGALHHCSPEFKTGPDQELEEGGARGDERTGVFSSGGTLSVIAWPPLLPGVCWSPALPPGAGISAAAGRGCTPPSTQTGAVIAMPAPVSTQRAQIQVLRSHGLRHT